MFIVPRELKESTPQQSIAIGNTDIIQYKHQDARREAEVLLEKNLILFVLEGSKKIAVSDQVEQVPSGQGIIVSKGAYVMTEVACEQRKCFSSIMLLVEDDFLADFVCLCQYC